MRRPASVVLAVALSLGAVACDDDSADPRTGGTATPSDQLSVRPAKPEPRPKAPPLAARFVAARSPLELARRVTRDEGLVRDPSTPDDLLAAAAFESQLLYRQLGRTPAWDDEVRTALPRRLRADLADHLRARRALRSVLTTLSDEVPAWEIDEPAPTADLRRFYREGQRAYGVPWEVLAAVNFVESGFGKIHGLSTAGAQGPMQFIPATWAAYGDGDIDDPHDAILAAARYLAANGGGAPGGVEAALYHYNNHPGYVAGVLAYASILRRDPRTLEAFVRWQVVYLSTIGDLWLPIGYRSPHAVPVREYAREHPERHLGTVTD